MRVDGYAPIREYAAIGDGRTVALVARDGSIDWLCLPNLDSPSVFGALLDAGRGGRFALAPEVRFEVERRYVPETNVLETTFSSAVGRVRVTDAMTLPNGGLVPLRELVRRVEGLAGDVPMRWTLQPRFEYAGAAPRVRARSGGAIASAGRNAVALSTWGAGDVEVAEGATTGRFRAREGSRSLLALSAAHQEPLVFPSREQAEKRLDGTVRFWRGWAGEREYDGPWRESVVRSLLALKLLVHAPTGAIAAAATTSLPEDVGGVRNWDYRFAWVRDAVFTLEAIQGLGCRAEAHAFFWWLQHASQLTHPRLQPLYRLDGGNRTRERLLPLEGYRRSRPVRSGNAASAQVQLDVYGELLQTVWLYFRGGARLDGDTGRRLAKAADHVCEFWQRPDAGIWEVRSETRHFTSSKMLCWVALDRAVRLAEEDELPRRHVERWRREAEEIRRFVEERCFSTEQGAYVRAAGSGELDASVLLASIFGYLKGDDERMRSTLDVLRRELGRGPLLLRYAGADGVPGAEGCFLACSFWLAEALALAGRFDEAGDLMGELLALANDVGLYAEEIDPETGDHLGNFPQALVHLAFVSAAACIAGLKE